jgi:4,5-DOPA dioxygenase extradiol
MIDGSTSGAAGDGGPERRQHGSVRRVPALFVSHGVPSSLLDTDYANALRRFSARQVTLDGIVVVSAHWESLRPVRVTRVLQPTLLHDFGSMPSPVERYTYPCRGHLGLADRAISLLEAAGIRALADETRGLDHGTWIPISIAYPSARFPVVQLSLPMPAEPEDVLAMGRALAPLRDENVLIVGSGGVVHNLHRLRFAVPDSTADPWAMRFDQWTREQVERLDVDALLQYRRHAPHALEAAPTPEHFLPMFFVLGTAEPGDRAYDVYEGFRYGSLSMRCFVLAGRRRDDLRGVDKPRPE